MRYPVLRIEFLITGVICTLCAVQTSAQVTIVESQDNNQPAVYKMTVSPAAEPRPALKYRFLVPPVDQIHANAATFYYKAMVFEGPDMWMPKEELSEKIETWREMPPEHLPVKEIADNVLHFYDQTAWQPLHQAAQCDHCDWGDAIREDGVATLLPQSQKMRSVARGIALRARVEIAGGEFSKAIDTLGLGYALSRNMGHGCCIVQSLIGMAISGILHEQLLTLIAADKSPNLYWAMGDLAAQPVDLRQAMSYETHLWEFSVHGVTDLDQQTLSPEDVLNLAKRIPNILDRHGFQNAAQIFLWAAVLEPEARKYLLAHGYTSDKLDAMPVLQVVLLYRWKQFLELRDDYFKWWLLPDEEMRGSVLASQGRVDAQIREGAGLPFSDALPSIRASMYAFWRAQRETNQIQLIEALRLYVAEHGQWPEKLDDITAVPVPLDPWSQKPFVYAVQNGVATIQPPSTPKAPWPTSEDCRYELALRAATKP